MKEYYFFFFILIFFLSSCLQEKKQKPSGDQHIILRSFFDDEVTESTFDQSQLQDLPRRVDLSSDLTETKYQGDRGTCAIFSTIGIIEAALKKDMGIEVNFSEEYLNFAIKNLRKYEPQIDGAHIQIALESVVADGLLLERDWGYQPSWFKEGLPCEKFLETDPESPAECFSHNRPSAPVMKKLILGNKLEFSYLRKNTNNLIRFLATIRRPLTLSINTNFKGWPGSGDVIYNQALRQECLDGSEYCGGHAVIISGYDLDKKIFFIKNNWGKEWGKNGFGTISFETVDLYVDSTFYYIEPNQKLDLPPDFNINYFNFKDFSSESFLGKDLLQIKSTIDIPNTHGQAVYVSSYVVKSKKSQWPPLDQDIKNFILSEAESSYFGSKFLSDIKYFIPNDEVNSIFYDQESPLEFNIPKEFFETPSFKNLLSSETFQPLLRTTIYVHTDVEDFKVLKRFYQPLVN